VTVHEDADADLLVIGWGSTYSAIVAGVRRARKHGHKVARIHLRHLNPFPANLGEVLGRYPKVLIPELNQGQLVRLLRAEYLTQAESYPKVQGIPFKISEIEDRILEMIAR
jgi:2-oxoglutarate ferredoxin oxidoreductase subunit alpha